MVAFAIGFIIGQLIYQYVLRPHLFPQFAWKSALRLWGKA